MSARVDTACKQIIRLIRRRGLRVGDHLPGQRELRGLLDASNDTLSAAMRLLADLGILTRHTRIGTRLADPAALSKFPWRVGVTDIQASSHGPGAFYSELLHFTLGALHEAGCESVTYFVLPQERTRWPPGIAGFPRLGEDLRQQRLDGLLLLTSFAREDWESLRLQGIPLCHAGDWPAMPCGMIIDRRACVLQGIEDLFRLGARKIAILDSTAGQYLGGERTDSLESILSRRQTRPLHLEHLDIQAGLQQGARMAETLLARPAGKRPDGLIALDDYAGMHLAGALVNAGSYRPHLAVMTSRVRPLHFALPVLRYEVDSAILAKTSVAMLLERLMDPGIPDERQWLQPLRAEDGPIANDSHE